MRGREGRGKRGQVRWLPCEAVRYHRKEHTATITIPRHDELKPNLEVSCTREPILTALRLHAPWTRSKRFRSIEPTKSPGTSSTTTGRTALAKAWRCTTKAGSPRPSSLDYQRTALGSALRMLQRRIPLTTSTPDTPRSAPTRSQIPPESRSWTKPPEIDTWQFNETTWRQTGKPRLARPMQPKGHRSQPQPGSKPLMPIRNLTQQWATPPRSSVRKLQNITTRRELYRVRKANPIRPEEWQ
ncbi:hypothetical protein GA0115239_106923 [Streptomyces sp. BpilaLS-43]|nr:hypothetical protein GA0115239_106923 [Streptomyces sp. BpilaLS-43]